MSFRTLCRSGRAWSFAVVLSLAGIAAFHVFEQKDLSQAAWWSDSEGWNWQIIPAGTQVTATGAFDLPTYLYSRQGDQSHMGEMPSGATGEYTGTEIKGWVQIRVKDQLFWVDYRSIAPVSPKVK